MSEPDGAPIRRRASLLLPISVLVGAIVAAALVGLVLARRGGQESRGERPVPQSPAAFLESLRIPDFDLIDQTGRPADQTIFDGNYTILAFTFTNCPAICPVMHSHLLRAQHELIVPPLRILTISVDPEHDTPEILRAYLVRLNIDPAHWTMLTGERPTIESLAAALKLGYTMNPDDPIPLKDGSGTMPNIDHSSKLVLVGPDRAVIDLASGLAWDGVERLVRLARHRVASTVR